jgi:hypothetical protein
MTKLVETSRTVIKLASFGKSSEKILRLLRLIYALLVSVYIAIMCLCDPRRRAALLGAY